MACAAERTEGLLERTARAQRTMQRTLQRATLFGDESSIVSTNLVR